MKNLTKKFHLTMICSFSLFFLGLSTTICAQAEIKETKKMIIITKKIDKDGKETIERIEKEGAEVNDAMIDQIIEEAKKNGKEVDIQIEKEVHKTIKSTKGETTKQISIEIDGEDIDLEGEDVMIFKTDDGKVIKMDESDKQEMEVEVTVDENGNQKIIKRTKKIIKEGDEEKTIFIEEEEGGTGNQEMEVSVDAQGKTTIITKKYKTIQKGADIEEKLVKLGIKLPVLGAPVANYVHAVTSNNWVFLAGKGPRKEDGTNVVGKLGKDLTVDQGYEAARLTGINLLAALKGEIGDLNRVVRIVKVHGMVNATADFTDHSKVINGFSDLMVEVFGEKGKHARAAVGMNSLPGNMAVEIEVVVEIE